MKGEDKLDNIGDRLVSEECLASRIRLTEFRLSAKLENKVRDQLASIPEVVEETIVRLLGHGGWAMK